MASCGSPTGGAASFICPVCFCACAEPDHSTPAESDVMRFICTKTVKKFLLLDDEGAVTVDWVVLTAAVVVLAALVLPVIIPGINAGASVIDQNVRLATQF